MRPMATQSCSTSPPVGFIVTTNCFQAWVAVRDGQVVGHVSLHTVWSDTVARLASSHTKCERTEIGAISRLFVAPSSRGNDLGRSLLDVAVTEATIRGLYPVLDVVTTYESAIALYESAGWERIGIASVDMSNGESIDEYVYVFDGVGPNRSGDALSWSPS